MKFKVGDRVRVIDLKSLSYGEEAIILRCGVRGDSCGIQYVGYEIDIPCVMHPKFPFCVFESRELEPIYDGHEKATWDTCVWQPNEVTV